MRTHVSGMQMKLATERELEDASLAEEVTVVEGRTFALSSKRGNRRFSCEDAYQARRDAHRPRLTSIVRSTTPWFTFEGDK